MDVCEPFVGLRVEDFRRRRIAISFPSFLGASRPTSSSTLPMLNSQPQSYRTSEHPLDTCAQRSAASLVSCSSFSGHPCTGGTDLRSPVPRCNDPCAFLQLILAFVYLCPRSVNQNFFSWCLYHGPSSDLFNYSLRHDRVADDERASTLGSFAAS